MKIGFFDSGLGGLILLSATTKLLPQYDYYYYGDTANLPYGDKSEEEIYRLSKMAMEHLFSAGCALVIIACNTASAETLRRLQDEFLPTAYPDRRILGVIIPTIEALNDSGRTKALLLATKRTVESQKYQRELGQKGLPGISIDSVATPQLVPLIESGALTEATGVATAVVADWAGQGDAVILGCTHYTLLKEALRVQFPTLQFIAQDELIPEKVKSYLEHHPEIATRLSKEGTRTVHLTAERADYDEIKARLLQN